MGQRICEPIHPGILTMQAMLRKIDRLRLPVASRRDVQRILVRQVSKELDRALPSQAGHGHRTAAISGLIGQAVGLTPGELHDLTLAAWLHDIGLLMLPTDLVESKDSLNPDAYIAIQSHSRLGATLLESFAFLREASILIAHHHERWDGSGYPYGIRGPFIPLGARILAIADAFDAIQVPNVHCLSQRQAIALRIIHVSAGSQFDPELVQVLAKSFNGIPLEDSIFKSSGTCAETSHRFGRDSSATRPPDRLDDSWFT
ncbi:MAG: HD domain-containing protein [Nitrospirae bacterium]|nr:HD domain-containing protein [Nitrospirota bacterium]